MDVKLESETVNNHDIPMYLVIYIQDFYWKESI